MKIRQNVHLLTVFDIAILSWFQAANSSECIGFWDCPHHLGGLRLRTPPKPPVPFCAPPKIESQIRHCMAPKIVYRADVRNDTNDEKKFYLGICDTPFKERFRNHKKKLTHKKQPEAAVQRCSKEKVFRTHCRFSEHIFL